MSKKKTSQVTVTDSKAKDNEIILKVASLIEKGSFGMSQITGHYFGNDHECCAMGAMYRAFGATKNDDLWAGSTGYPALGKLGAYSWPRIAFPDATFTSDNPPPFASTMNMAALPDVVIYLNDRLGWSFDKIVAYLRDSTLPQATTIKLKRQKR